MKIKIDEHFFMSKLRIIIALLMLVLCAVNCYLKSQYLSGIILGIDILVIIEAITSHIIYSENIKRDLALKTIINLIDKIVENGTKKEEK